MAWTVTPIAVFHRQIECVRSNMAGVRDGRLDSIHDARIATRRIREVLPLTQEWQRRHEADYLLKRFKQMGRSLGRVRDGDARIELLRYCEARIPRAAPALIAARQEEEARRLRRTRKLLKRLERLSMENELSRLIASAPWKHPRVWITYAGGWRDQLQQLVTDRATDVRDAVAHATGVYFPKRAHRTRIAIKKLRYAAEIAAQIGYEVSESVIRDLKKTTDILGDQRDRQALVDEFAAESPDTSSANAEQIRTIGQVLDAEIKDLHERYLLRRDSIVVAAADIASVVERRSIRVGTLTAAGVIALAGVGIIRRERSAERHAPRTRDVRVPDVDGSAPVAASIARVV